jgi:predicted chitinase
MVTKNPLSPSETVKLLVKTCLEEGVTDHGQIANVLGQCQHESDNWAVVEEYSSGSQYQGRNDLGNTQAGDGVKYKGRGYVQITGRLNYKKMGQLFGRDLENDPTIAEEPIIAAKIAVVGMRDGRFTGVGLSKYIKNGNNDFYNARRIVNGLDKASLLAGYSEKWLAQVPDLVNGAEPDPNSLPTPSNSSGASSGGSSSSSSASGGISGGTGLTAGSVGVCDSQFPIKYTLKEALTYLGCISREIGNPMGGSSSLAYSANGMKVNGGSSFNIADFNPTVPICEGCLAFPFARDIPITSPFCQRRKRRVTYYHSGTDYGAP